MLPLEDTLCAVYCIKAQQRFPDTTLYIILSQQYVFHNTLAKGYQTVIFTATLNIIISFPSPLFHSIPCRPCKLEFKDFSFDEFGSWAASRKF